MSDLGSANYSEVDASNTAAVPNGWPEGMAASGVNNSARSNMGAEKRFWNRINAIKTTGGTSSTYTLTYDQSAAQYYDGEIHSFVVNATNAVDATLNINAIGARQIRLFGGNILAGALQADQIVQVRYNLAATAFDIIGQNGWVRLGAQSPSGASTVDFASIPAAVNHLMAMVELDPSVDGTTISLRTAGADGAFDAGASDYYYIVQAALSGGTTSVTAVTTSSILLGNPDNGTTGLGCRLEAFNIQAATNTKFTFQSSYLDSAGLLAIHLTGTGVRTEGARITGLRFLPSSGTVTGRITLFGSA